MSTGTAATNADPAVRPFHVDIAEEAIADLRRRIAAWRPPEREPVDDQSQGVQLATVQDLANYWATEYDWRRCEAKLNALEQFTAAIDGLDIHFIHVHPRPVASAERAAADRLARLARLDHRTAEDHRAAHQSRRTRRERAGRIRPRYRPAVRGSAAPTDAASPIRPAGSCCLQVLLSHEPATGPAVCPSRSAPIRVGRSSWQTALCVSALQRRPVLGDG